MGEAADDAWYYCEEMEGELQYLHQTKKCGGIQAGCPFCVIEEEYYE